jgi:hypothetical protein
VARPLPSPPPSIRSVTPGLAILIAQCNWTRAVGTGGRCWMWVGTGAALPWPGQSWVLYLPTASVICPLVLWCCEIFKLWLPGTVSHFFWKKYLGVEALQCVVDLCLTFFFVDWSLNSGLCACKAHTIA